ncbi:DUF3265 domain-containing protein [Vibrio harveyi]
MTVLWFQSHKHSKQFKSDSARVAFSPCVVFSDKVVRGNLGITLLIL